MVRRVSAGEDEADVTLFHQVAGPVADAGLQPGLGHRPEAEGLVVEVGRLLGVAHVELDVVIALDGQEILGHGLPSYPSPARPHRPNAGDAGPRGQCHPRIRTLYR